MKKLLLLALFLLLLTAPFYLPNILHSNEGESVAVGTPRKGSLENAYQIDFFNKNYRFFSWISYFFMDNGFLHSKLYQSVVDSYAECETTCPDIDFRIMECSNTEGGPMYLHKSHRNGMSIDFMTPLTRDGKPYTLYDHLGLWHYFLEFDADGRLSFDKEVSIDFETMAKHIIALDNATRKNGLRIRIVILKINLKAAFFKTPSGQEVKRRNIYFARKLDPFVDSMHDDHYHIDFTVLI